MPGARPGLCLPHGVPRPHFPPERRGHTSPTAAVKMPVEVMISGQGNNTPNSGNPNSSSVLWREETEEEQSGGI